MGLTLGPRKALKKRLIARWGFENYFQWDRKRRNFEDDSFFLSEEEMRIRLELKKRKNRKFPPFISNR